MPLLHLPSDGRMSGSPSRIPDPSRPGLAAPQFLHNVSINLKDGGYFIGTVPDGKRVNACIKQ